MGFFSGLFSDPKVTTPATGFYSQPQAYQDLYTNTAGAANNTIFPGGQLNTAMFHPVPQNSFEQRAGGMIQNGVTPTAQSLQSDISMLMNPYDDYVIGGINRESQGQNSLVNQAASLAGQQGSNRSFLGTSDVEQNRLNNIGQFKQGQYNNAVNLSLGQLAGLRQQDISNNSAQGALQRGIETQGQQAPLSALQAAQGILGGLPTQFGNFGAQASESGGGFNIGKALSTAGTIASFFSDRRLKKDIEFYGREKGHNVYKFKYQDDDSGKVFIGVMADEVKETHPEAVEEVSGYLAVNYDKIGVEFREAE